MSLRAGVRRNGRAEARRGGVVASLDALIFWEDGDAVQWGRKLCELGRLSCDCRLSVVENVLDVAFWRQSGAVDPVAHAKLMAK